METKTFLVNIIQLLTRPLYFKLILSGRNRMLSSVFLLTIVGPIQADV